MFFSSLHDGARFMPRAYRQLALDERRTIFRLLNAKVPMAEIGSVRGSGGNSKPMRV